MLNYNARQEERLKARLLVTKAPASAPAHKPLHPRGQLGHPTKPGWFRHTPQNLHPFPRGGTHRPPRYPGLRRPASPRPPSPLTSCTMPMVPPVLMTSTRASVEALQPPAGAGGGSWGWGAVRALPSGRCMPAVRNRYLPGRPATSGVIGAVRGPPLPAPGGRAGSGVGRAGRRGEPR